MNAAYMKAVLCVCAVSGGSVKPQHSPQFDVSTTLSNVSNQSRSIWETAFQFNPHGELGNWAAHEQRPLEPWGPDRSPQTSSEIEGLPMGCRGVSLSRKETITKASEAARLRQAEAFRQCGDVARETAVLLRLLRDYPLSHNRPEVIQKLFELADFLLDTLRSQLGLMRKLREERITPWWELVYYYIVFTRSVAVENQAVRILEQILALDPDGPYTDRALYLIGTVAFVRDQYLQPRLPSLASSGCDRAVPSLNQQSRSS